MGKRARERKRARASKRARIAGRKSNKAIARAERIQRHHPGSKRAHAASRHADKLQGKTNERIATRLEVIHTTRLRDEKPARIAARRAAKKAARNKGLAKVGKGLLAPFKVVAKAADDIGTIGKDLAAGAKASGEGAKGAGEGLGSLFAACVIL